MRFRTPAWGAMVVCLCVGAFAERADAATIAVPAGGDLQAALNAALPGDVITLVPGAVYTGNFTLPDKGPSTAFITVRSAAPDSALPPEGVRITPAYASQLPKIQSATSVSALRTKNYAHHWKLMFLEFRANMNGYGDIIQLGSGDTSQYDLSQVAHDLVLDRVYVHGDPVMGQKRGVALNSRDTTVINSYIADIKAVGQDAQALGGFNGPGNYLIENNYLEAAGENFILGGADPPIPNLVTSNVVFRRNHLRKPLEWRTPIIATPQDISAVAAIGAGTLAAGTYAYKIVARVPAGGTTKANSIASAEVSATIAAGTTGGVALSWTPVVGAADYLVYGRTAGATNQYWKTTTASFTDSGAAGTSASPSSGTKWTVKNLFELKNAQDVLVEGNVFENCWVADQPGYPIVLTPRNQSGNAPWSVVQRVTIQYNLIRHSAGGVNILGSDDLHPSQLTNNLIIRDNIWDDVGTAWGSGSKTFQMGAGGDKFTFDHNTIDSTDNSLVAPYGGSATNPTVITGFVYTNNMAEHRSYGFMGAALAPGFPTINAYFPGAVIRRNVLAGGSSSKYPTDNFFPTVAAWKAEFVNYDLPDYHLLSTSVDVGIGTDGRNLGADVDAVMSQAANALSGDNRLAPGIIPVRITTSTLPDAVFHEAYSQSLACAGGSMPCAWSLVDASLPAGLAFDSASGAVAGTPTDVQTGTVTVLAFDPSAPANNTTATLMLTVAAPAFGVSVPPAPAGQVGSPYALAAVATGAVGSVSWNVAPGSSLPSGLGIDAVSGTIAGTPTTWGTSTAVIQAADSWRADRTASAALTITIAPSPISVAPVPVASGQIQQYFQMTLNATGGSGSTSWAMIGGALPAGVFADTSGSISGTPTALGTFTATFEATDVNWPSHKASAAVTIAVSAQTFKAWMPVAPAGQVGVAYYLAGSTSGQIGGVAWSVVSGSLPPGLPINPATGVIAGVPTAPGTFSATVQARDTWDSSRTVSMPVAISVAPAPLAIMTTGLPAGTASRSYAASLTATGGTGTTSWSIVSGALPMGLTLSTSGAITGVPVSAGTASITVCASDAGWPGNSATQSLSLSIASGEIVLYAADATRIAGAWSLVADPTAAAGKRIVNPDVAAPKLATALQSPANYFELTFQAEAGVAYHLWMRGKADKNYWGNDSVYVQFAGSVTSTGAATTRIGTTAAEVVSIENGANAGLSGWGWNDNAYDGLGTPIYFATTGTQTLRVQVREDGLSIDQIVLSPMTYVASAPGAAKNDTTIVAK